MVTRNTSSFFRCIGVFLRARCRLQEEYLTSVQSRHALAYITTVIIGVASIRAANQQRLAFWFNRPYFFA